MKNKGFTLIELLAVIIIIGIIAVITMPIINNSIKESRENLAKSSALSYKKAVDQYIYQQTMNKNDINLNGKYNILNGKIGNYEIEVNGSVPTEGFLTYRNNELKNGCLYINNYAIVFSNGEVSSITKESCDNFNPGYELPQIVTTGDGLYESTTEKGRYIYRGANPDNYIWLDENGDGTKTSSELYRIISYEKDDTIKVIRDASIGSFAWDNRTDASSGPRHNENNTYCNYTGTYYGCNVWGNASNTYYNDTKLTTLNQNFFYKYFPNNTTQTLQNYTNTGTVTQNSSLNDYLNTEWTPAQTLDSYIIEHSFNVGGIYYYGSFTGSYTGGDKGLSKEKEEQNSYTWNGKIGLMNITEYVEASINPTCTSVYSNFFFNTEYFKNGIQTITGYDNWPCSNRTYNWMPKAINEWTLSPNAGSRYEVWFVNYEGDFYYYNASSSPDGVRPAFYLKSTTKLSGSGTSDNPYYIAS